MKINHELQKINKRDKIVTAVIIVGVAATAFFTRKSWDNLQNNSNPKCVNVQFTTGPGGPGSTNVIAIPKLENVPKSSSAFLVK